MKALLKALLRDPLLLVPWCTKKLWRRPRQLLMTSLHRRWPRVLASRS